MSSNMTRRTAIAALAAAPFATPAASAQVMVPATHESDAELERLITEYQLADLAQCKASDAVDLARYAAAAEFPEHLRENWQQHEDDLECQPILKAHGVPDLRRKHEHLYDVYWSALERAIAAPARSVRGIALKLRLLTEFADLEQSEHDRRTGEEPDEQEELFANIMRDCETMISGQIYAAAAE